MQCFNNKNKLFDLMAQGATVITPNNRLSAALLQHYFLQSTHKTLDKPNCMPYRSVLIQAFEQFKYQNPKQFHPILLNAAQCQHLWRNLIQSHTQITYSEGLLKAVMQAWEFCHLWNIDPKHPAFNHTQQTQQFQEWWQTADQNIQELELITEHQLAPYLISRSLSKEGSIVWACFDDFNPQQQKLQKYFDQQGLSQYTYDLAENTAIPEIFAATDTKEEYQQLIAWLNFRLQQGDQRIGVVVPELQQQSRRLQRLFKTHFDPSVFDISLGQSLEEFPLIAHALTWLDLEMIQITHHQAALLLQSPYLGQAKEEFLNRCQYLQDSSLLQDQTLPLKRFAEDIKPQAPKLAELLTAIKPYPQQAAPHEWVQLFQERLNALGFPGDYGLNSENYQCLNRFNSIFDELRQLTVISCQLTARQALEAFNQLIKNTIFQAQKSNARMQISGLLEASGCEFDSLWVMGLTDQCLPQKTHLSAFIPPQLQRDLLMPHSSPARELQYAQQTLQRLQKGSSRLIFSYPRLQGDYPNLPCSLINTVPVFAKLAVDNQLKTQTQLIAEEEVYALPLQADEHHGGGTALLANQAKCPFKAFAEHRLRAKPVQETADGLDNRERGQVLHKVMELLWQTLKSQELLLQLSAQALDTHIDAALETTLQPLSQIHPDSFPSLVQDVEYTRLKRLVLTYLEWEKQRPAFEIAALEHSYSINLAGLDFKVRVDRIDQVGESKWVIDYKTSLPASKPWNEDRPKEPQLLLYALLEEQINALLLLQLKAGAISCNGLSEHPQDLPGISTLKKGQSWEQSRSIWREQLTLLADEFKQGHCPPQPANLSICQHCDFQNLCRFQAVE